MESKATHNIREWLTRYVQIKFDWGTHNMFREFTEYIDKLEQRIEVLENGREDLK